MMVHARRGDVLLDFFVAAPGLDGIERGAELVPVPVHFDAETVQTSTSGRRPAGCRGRPRASASALRAVRLDAARRRWSAAAIRLRPRGRAGQPPSRPTSSRSSRRSTSALRGTRELYAPEGRTLREGDVFRFPELAEALERFAAEGAEPFYRGEIGEALADFVIEHGGTLGRRGPGRLRGDRAGAGRGRASAAREVLTNPPPVLRRDPDRLRPRPARAARAAQRAEQLVAAMDAANRARGDEFAEGLHGAAWSCRPCSTRRAARRCSRRRRPGRRPLGSTTHIIGARRRWDVRQRHLLERLGLRCPGARHRRPSSTTCSARRTSTRSASTPSRRAARALDDVADGGAARRRDRARASAAPAPTGSARRSCRRSFGWSSDG